MPILFWRQNLSTLSEFNTSLKHANTACFLNRKPINFYFFSEQIISVLKMSVGTIMAMTFMVFSKTLINLGIFYGK